MNAGPKIIGKIDLANAGNYINKFTGTPNFVSTHKGSHVGRAMAMGDIDQDGQADFLLLSVMTDAALYVLMGKDSGSWGTAKESKLSELADAKKILKLVTGKDPGDSPFTTINLVGKFGGGPFDKDVVAAGAGDYGINGATVGAVYLFWNEFDFTKKGTHDIGNFKDSYNKKAITLQGATAGGGFGGTPPVAMGDNKLLVPAMYIPAKSYLIQGPLFGSAAFPVTDKAITVFNDDKGEIVGRYATSGDINCDGHSDLFLSSDNGKFGGGGVVGGVYVFLGSKNGWPISVTTDNADLKLIGGPFSEAGPVTIADLNGDGFPDIAVGGQGTNAGAGVAWVLSGKVLADQGFLKGCK